MKRDREVVVGFGAQVAALVQEILEGVGIDVFKAGTRIDSPSHKHGLRGRERLTVFGQGSTHSISTHSRLLHPACLAESLNPYDLRDFSPPAHTPSMSPFPTVSKPVPSERRCEVNRIILGKVARRGSTSTRYTARRTIERGYGLGLSSA